jgi:hypothetical protein
LGATVAASVGVPPFTQERDEVGERGLGSVEHRGTVRVRGSEDPNCLSPLLHENWQVIRACVGLAETLKGGSKRGFGQFFGRADRGGELLRRAGRCHIFGPVVDDIFSHKSGRMKLFESGWGRSGLRHIAPYADGVL